MRILSALIIYFINVVVKIVQLHNYNFYMPFYGFIVYNISEGYQVSELVTIKNSIGLSARTFTNPM